MKHTFTLLAVVVLLGCKKENIEHPQNNLQATSISNNSNLQTMMRYSGSGYSQPITIDTANRMIESYLTSINYLTNTTTLRSFSFDADTLRNYLANNDVKTLKFMFAHKQEYIKAGNYGQDAGLHTDAITIVIVGLSENDSYIYNNKGMVYDHVQPCPYDCNETSPLLTQ